MNENKTKTWKELNELRNERQELLKKPFDSISFKQLEELNLTISKYVAILVAQSFNEDLEK